MKIYDHPNYGWYGGFSCPVCGTNLDRPVVVVPIVPTLNDTIVENIQVHVECLELEYCPGNKDSLPVIVMHLPKEK